MFRLDSVLAWLSRYMGFQSTLSSRRATQFQLCPVTWIGISIHALLTESDIWLVCFCPIMIYFNPRSPHGERRPNMGIILHLCPFQSTLSSRRATAGFAFVALDPLGFQSTLSSRRATRSGSGKSRSLKFQSTLSSRRATLSRPSQQPLPVQFQSTLSSRRAT